MTTYGLMLFLQEQQVFSLPSFLKLMQSNGQYVILMSKVFSISFFIGIFQILL